MLLLPLRHPIQRRLSDVDVALLDQVPHLPEEEGEQKRADVRTVHVCIRHDDDLVIAGLLEFEVLPDAASDGCDHRPDLFVREDLVDSRSLHVEDLALERQDGLERPVSTLLRAPAGAVSLDQVDLAQARIRDGTVREFPREDASLEGTLLASQIPGLPGSLSGPRGRQ